jgi:hypothetical protein
MKRSWFTNQDDSISEDDNSNRSIPKTLQVSRRHMLALASLPLITPNFILAQAPGVMRVGSNGEAVAELNAFLQRFGYFRDTEGVLLSAFGALPKLPKQMRTFDESTRRALILYQLMHSLEPTGELDTPTKHMMSEPRCGNADLLVPTGYVWDHLDLSYSFQELTPDMSANRTRAAFARACQVWQEETLLRLTEVPSGGEITVRFVTGAHGDNQPFNDRGQYGHASYPPPYPFPGQIHFNDLYSFIDDPAGSVGTTDLIGVAIHELGHALGLAHSSNQKSVMFPTFRGLRSLDEEDKAAIVELYNPALGSRWIPVWGDALDLAVNGNSSTTHVYHIGTNVDGPGGNSVYKWDGAGWNVIPGIAAAVIAAAPDGTLWHVNKFGDIYRGREPVGGKAIHIAIGGDGTVVHVSNDLSQPGGGALYRWTGSAWAVIPNLAGVMVAVVPGQIWHVNRFGAIYRNHQEMPGRATDIAAGADGTVCHVGTTETGQTGRDLNRWSGRMWQRYQRTSAIGVAVGPNGMPWHFNKNLDMYRRV